MGMTPEEIVVRLPEDLAQEAREFGLLTEATFVSLLRDEVDRRVMALVNAEIREYCAEKAARQGAKRSK
jgi:hypothetical protein